MIGALALLMGSSCEPARAPLPTAYDFPPVGIGAIPDVIGAAEVAQVPPRWEASAPLVVLVDTADFPALPEAGSISWTVTVPSRRLRVKLGLVFVPGQGNDPFAGGYPIDDPTNSTIFVTPQVLLNGEPVDVQPLMAAPEALHWNAGWTIETDTAADVYRLEFFCQSDKTDFGFTAPGTWFALPWWVVGPKTRMRAEERAALRSLCQLAAPTAIRLGAAV